MPRKGEEKGRVGDRRGKASKLHASKLLSALSSFFFFDPFFPLAPAFRSIAIYSRSEWCIGLTAKKEAKQGLAAFGRLLVYVFDANAAAFRSCNGIGGRLLRLRHEVTLDKKRRRPKKERRRKRRRRRRTGRKRGGEKKELRTATATHPGGKNAAGLSVEPINVLARAAIAMLQLLLLKEEKKKKKKEEATQPSTPLFLPFS